MDNDVISYLNKKFEIYLNLYDYLYPFNSQITLYVKENINNLYFELINDRNIMTTNIHLNGNQITSMIKYNGKKYNFIIVPYLNFPDNEINILNELINVKDSIDMTSQIVLHDNSVIIENTMIIMDLIRLLCHGFKIDEELENFILENIDEIKINFKENKLCKISEILFKLNYINFGNLINEKNYIYEILFDLEYNNKLIETINPKSMIELYVSILYDKYFIIDDINKINETLSLYKMENNQILFIKTVFEIFNILNSICVDENLKIGKIIKKFQYVEDYTIKYSIGLFNNIFNEKYDIDKIQSLMNDEMLKKFVSYKNVEIPKYKDKIQKYQNIMVYVYGDLYHLEYYDWIILENLFEKYMVRMKV